MRPPFTRVVPRKAPGLPPLDMLIADVLSFLGDDPDRFERLLSTSGLAIGDLRAASAAPGFAESLLDHLCSDERLLLPFALSRGHDPSAIERLRLSLTPSFEV